MIRFFIKLVLVIVAFTYGIVPGLCCLALFVYIKVDGKRVW